MLLTKHEIEKLLTHYAESVPIFLSMAEGGQRYFRMTNYNVISSHTPPEALGFFHQQGFQIDRWYIAADLQQNSDRKHISCRVHPTNIPYMVVPEESRRGGVGRFMLKYMFVEDDIVRGIMAWEPGHLVELVEWVRDLNSIREEPIKLTREVMLVINVVEDKIPANVYPATHAVKTVPVIGRSQIPA
ncbi:hypothetical protein SPFM7_00194 [Salmonella phage SPFM7]|nr:hypothetical protein SPFM7_00194 [Salmonella phage SPFM7]